MLKSNGEGGILALFLILAREFLNYSMMLVVVFFFFFIFLVKLRRFPSISNLLTKFNINGYWISSSVLSASI